MDFFFFFYTINHFTGQRTGYSILSLPLFLINPIFGTNNNLLGFPDIIVSCVVEPFSIFRSLLITGEKYRVIVLKSLIGFLAVITEQKRSHILHSERP